ncbi:MAG TPA: BTAD domain-containing putative transcriptional regulator [Longimicrobiales bacterium]|nr:BTAD domain-containing putative transcriptional regulator [Longimicrobiales bacterium]
MSSSFRLKTLGELRLEGPDGDVRELRRRERALLARIARCAPAPIRRAELTALLWGERDDARAKHALRQALFALRRVLGDALEVGGENVRLRPGTVELDVTTLEAELSAGRAAAAFDLWHGAFLDGVEEDADDTFRSWIESERAVVRRLLESALEMLRVAAQSNGAWDDVAPRARRLAEAHPWDEAAQRRLVETLRDAGCPEEAAAVLSRFSARVRSDLGIEPSDGFVALGTELETALRRPALAGRPEIATPVLVGRGKVRTEVLDAWQEVTRGAARCVLIEGVDGSGRTRFCDEVAAAVLSHCPASLVLRAQRDTEADKEAWSTAARLLAPLRAAPGLSGVADDVLAELALLVPSIRERFPSLPEARGGPDALGTAVERVLADVADEIPILILADDLAEFDSASRRCVGQLAARLPSRVLLVATASHAALDADADLRSLRRQPCVRPIGLRALMENEVAALIGSMIELSAADRVVLGQRILEEAGGEPLAAVETIAALADEGRLVADRAGGPWRLTTPVDSQPLPSPPLLRRTLQRRLARLSAAARDVLSAAAVLGRASEPELLGALTGLSPAAVDDAAAELNAHGILADGEFVHASMRRTAEAMLGQGDRVRLHRTAAATLQRDAQDAPARARVRYHRERAGSRRSRLIATGMTLVVGLSMIALPSLRGTAPAPVMAVASLSGRGLADDDPALRALPEILSTELSRVGGLRLIGRSRMLELMARAADSRSAAAAGGIGEVLEGELSADSIGYTLVLRRVDVRSGRVRMEYTAEASDAMELGRRAASAVAASLGYQLTATSGGSPGFVAARALYEEGLQAFYVHRDYRSAMRLFTRALEQDPTFAMAAFHEARCATMLLDAAAAAAPLARAEALADKAPERDQLLIRAYVAEAFNDPGFAAVAESLAVRYPQEPWGPLLAGNALGWAGHFLAAVARWRQVVALEPLSQDAAAPCAACDAYASIVGAYWFADSLPAALRVAREWLSRQPQNPTAWLKLAEILEVNERYDEADVALRRAAQLGSDHAEAVLWEALRGIRRGDFATADAALDYFSRVSDRDVARDAVWYQVVSFRTQGRYREAGHAAERYRELTLQRTPARHPFATPQAVVLQETGSPLRAAALFDTMFHGIGELGRVSRTSRDQAWLLTLRASALAAAGDTASLHRLADTIQTIGARSSYGRDARLHHHVRGMLARARGDLPAAEAELRAAIFSTTGGYTRTNLELARVHIARGNAAQAIPLLQAALRGPLDAAALYATRTEVHEELARAFDAAGRADSAASHYRSVITAWKHADRPLAARIGNHQRRLATLSPANE